MKIRLHKPLHKVVFQGKQESELFPAQKEGQTAENIYRRWLNYTH